MKENNAQEWLAGAKLARHLYV